MTLPTNIRINLSTPFPSLVQGTAPITINKQNGIWTVGFSINVVGSENPPPVTAWANDYLLAYDAVANQTFRVPFSAVVGGARIQRSVTASPIVVATTDMTLNVNISSSSPTCTLPAAATRNGVPLTFKDVGGNFAAHNLTITPNGSETIDGTYSSSAPLVLTQSRQSITLNPFNDGVNSGWFIT